MQKTKLFEILSEILGVEPEDINSEDSLREDLHMNSVDLAEFSEKITEARLGVVDLSEIETVEELVDQLNLEEVDDE